MYTLTTDMQRAMRSATSVHVSGRIVQPSKTIGLNLGVLRSGQLAGTISSGGVPINIISAGSGTFVKATPAFLRGLRLPSTVCATICGKYLKVPASKASALTDTVNMPALTGLLTMKSTHFTGLSTTTFRGKPVYVLHTKTGGTVRVSQAAPHLPVAVVSPHNRYGALVYSDWNAVPKPTAPPQNQIASVGNGGHPVGHSGGK